MATSQKAFQQVKNILGKLDRNIDQLRERRLGDPVTPTPGLAPQPGGTIGAAANGTHNGAIAAGLGGPRPDGIAATPVNPMNILIGAKAPAQPAPAAQPAPSTANLPNNVNTAANNSPRSPYGRAQPLRRDAI